MVVRVSLERVLDRLRAMKNGVNRGWVVKVMMKAATAFLGGRRWVVFVGFRGFGLW